MNENILGIIAGILTSAAMVSATHKSFKRKKCRRHFLGNVARADFRTFFVGLVWFLTRRITHYSFKFFFSNS
ncbi:uncharacterized protein with PQ loop repeat [Chryseobacterium ginsenosidimutans]|nr:uncharacterized protein with PQ loop repeat [Chryseobacterium ginsenosidimutans]